MAFPSVLVPPSLWFLTHTRLFTLECEIFLTDPVLIGSSLLPEASDTVLLGNYRYLLLFACF